MNKIRRGGWMTREFSDAVGNYVRVFLPSSVTNRLQVLTASLNIVIVLSLWI
jgi:hypothetical protein